MSESATPPKRELTAILVGGLIAATFDIVQVTIFYAVKGVDWIRIPQSVASGLLGKASYSGGMSTVVLGYGLHYAMALVMAAVYVLAARRLDILVRRPWLMGTLYGLGLYVVMTYGVVPLSMAKGGHFNWPSFIDGILAHTLAVGVPIALAARWARRAGAASDPV
jgi:hypothetical protein